eukprot:1590535-Pleurochrysis_carterae.AAC.1
MISFRCTGTEAGREEILASAQQRQWHVWSPGTETKYTSFGVAASMGAVTSGRVASRVAQRRVPDGARAASQLSALSAIMMLYK